ncbi:ceramide synthase [Protopterus annectens]|uniref:ceramide synthase n=1 Tax=Protopterus annectens TaxID=7888 RepID=UPI001CFA5BD6|nr:ceramide synthase [Protopterus annectens]
MLKVVAAGCLWFPGLFLLTRRCLKKVLGWEESDAVIVSARLVSSVQAVMATTAGYIVSISCQHVIDDQHWLASTYTQFAVPYFVYDIYAMFLCSWHKYKVKGHDTCFWSIPVAVKSYLWKDLLMVLHHVFMVVVCFPVSVLWRGGKGDFFLGCMLMAELSTPFVCLGKILIQYKKQHTLLHKVNGLLMLVTFFICRILLFPYMYWVYGQHVGLPLYKVPFFIPMKYNLGSFILMAPQVYWFFLICKGAFKLFRRPKLKEEHVKNGHFMDSHMAKVPDQRSIK